jgi:hypothetical protein
LFGISLPPLDAVLFTGVGFIIPPVVSNLIMGYLPVEWKASKLTYYGVKAASVILPSMLVKKFVSQRAGNLMLLGGAVSFALDMVKEFAPTLLPAPGMGMQPFLGLYQRAPYQRTMGRYVTGQSLGVPGQVSSMIASSPDRLSPQGRF